MPINPEELKISQPGNNENAEVIGLGEVNIIRERRLIPISIESFFPEDKNPKEYINFFNLVQKSKRPMRIICKGFDLNLQVSIDGFEYSMRAGEEGDRYYTLELQEWRDYSPKKVGEGKKPEEGGKPSSDSGENKNKEEKKDFQKDDVVKFNGGNHYHTSQDTKPTGKPRKAGNAKITLTAPGSKHPYHLIGTPGGSDVYGWVDEGSFSK